VPLVTSDAFIHCQVPAATKAAFSALASRQGVTDSALSKRMIELALQSANPDTIAAAEPSGGREPSGAVSRLTVRLRAEDVLLLQERASARGLVPAT
jgi:hypothetical protein